MAYAKKEPRETARPARHPFFPLIYIGLDR